MNSHEIARPTVLGRAELVGVVLESSRPTCQPGEGRDTPLPARDKVRAAERTKARPAARSNGRRLLDGFKHRVHKRLVAYELGDLFGNRLRRLLEGARIDFVELDLALGEHLDLAK